MKLIIIVLLMILALNLEAEIEKCPKCSAPLMSGTKHKCWKAGLERKKKQEKEARLKAERMAQCRKRKEEAKEEMLPRLHHVLSSYDVVGVAINPVKEYPQLVCKERSFSADSSPFKSFDIHDDRPDDSIAVYYKTYCAQIPVLGVQGIKSGTKIEDATVRAAIDQLRAAQANAQKKLKADLEDEQTNFRQYHTPLKCLAGNARYDDEGVLSRTWKDNKGCSLDGVWIADYKTLGIDGIVIFSKGKKMLKIPISALCEEDALLIKKERASPDVKRFKLTTITVPDGSPLAKRFRRVGFNELKFEALVFAQGVSTSGEPVQYVQLYPGGQICEMPMGGSLLKENPTERDRHRYDTLPRNLGMSKVSDADAVKGPTWVLEQKIKERSLAKEEAEEIERRRLYEKPFRDAFDRLRVELEETAYKMELCNPERDCEVHQWKTCYAPTVEQQSAYGANYMNALELLKKGLLECSCDKELIQQYEEEYEEAKKECHALKNKMQELQKTHPEIDFLKEVYY